MSQMTPREIVQELDKHIIGQDEAKRAVAIALRNRWRRVQVGEPLRSEITPKNILMIGPTGVGKTEISRRLARLAKAPFIKVEATKFTEVGYVGREVDSIVRDLMDVAVKMTREEEMSKVRFRAEDAAEERILDALLPRPSRGVGFAGEPEPAPADSETGQKFRKMLREGKLDDKEIEIEIQAVPVGVERSAGRLRLVHASGRTKVATPQHIGQIDPRTSPTDDHHISEVAFLELLKYLLSLSCFHILSAFIRFDLSRTRVSRKSDSFICKA